MSARLPSASPGSLWPRAAADGVPLTEPVLSVDLGGTRMRAAVVAAGGAVLRRRVEPTPRRAACPDALVALMAGFLGSNGAAEAVVGVPGRVDYATGRLEHAPNLPPAGRRP